MVRTDPGEADPWRLMRGTELVAEIDIEDADQPWLIGRLRPRPGFTDVKPLFDRQLALMRANPKDYEALDRIYDRINAELKLIAPHGPVAEYWLQLHGDRAWFRWSDEPLDHNPNPQ